MQHSDLDAPPGWTELQERMKRAKTGEEVNRIADEMKMLLNAYEAKTRNKSLASQPIDETDQPQERKR